MKVKNFFKIFLDLGPGSAWEPEELLLWEQRCITFSELQSALQYCGENRATKAPKDVGKKPLGTKSNV